MTSPITGLSHVGVRVHDLARSRAFYEKLGFVFVAGPLGPEPVAILRHPAGVELNLILNAPLAAEPNILMDVEQKHPGYTHVALRVSSVDAACTLLDEAGIPLSGRREDVAVFIRDPDRNVIELAADGPS
jgi:lactoylglutathione lyase